MRQIFQALLVTEYKSSLVSRNSLSDSQSIRLKKICRMIMKYLYISIHSRFLYLGLSYKYNLKTSQINYKPHLWKTRKFFSLLFSFCRIYLSTSI